MLTKPLASISLPNQTNQGTQYPRSELHFFLRVKKLYYTLIYFHFRNTNWAKDRQGPMKPKGQPTPQPTSRCYGQKDDANMAPFANRGRLPMVPMFTNTLLIFCISIPCGWLLQKPLYFIRINPLLLTFTNILWTILIYYLIDSLCCGWFLQTPCWYFVLSIPCSWFLQTTHGSLYILIGSTPVVDFYKHPVGILCYQSPAVDFCKHPMGHFIYY